MTNRRERIDEIVSDATGRLSDEQWEKKYGDAKYYELLESLIRQAQAEAIDEYKKSQRVGVHDVDDYYNI